MSTSSSPESGQPTVASFGQLLRRHRQDRQLTQAALAQQAGCSPEVLRKYEADAKRPSQQLAERLAAALGLSGTERSAFVGSARGSAAAPVSSPPPPATPAPLTLDWLARTKLLPPRVRRDVLVRERLVATARASVGTARLLLVSAPAGSGKTTLLTTALAAIPGYETAWLTLDDEDNDLVRFLHALVEALGPFLPPGLADQAAVLLADRSGPAQDDAATFSRRLAGALLNGLADGDAPLVLVLDDLHVVAEPAIYALLDYLLDHLPPTVTVAVGTRYDPPLALTRLRVRRELVELRLPDLRFTAAEVGALLNQQHALNLSAPELEALYSRTEGWAAGLTLLASSLERIGTTAERGHFLDRLVQTDRYLFDYLADEILNRQDPFVRMFLLETSILPELSPAACRAITGRSDAVAILDELYRRNLFLVALDEPGSEATYRYHDLFREFLRGRLERERPEWSRELNLRAAEAASSAAVRIYHYMQAEQWDAAADTIGAVADSYLAQGAYDTVRQWIGRLPEAIRSARPRLELTLGMCLWQRFEFDPALAAIARALAGFDAIGDPAGQAEALVWISLGANLWADAQTAQTMIDRALATPLRPDQRIRVLLAYALGLTLHQRWPVANDAFDEAIELAVADGNASVITELATNIQAPLGMLPGGVARFERVLGLLAGVDTRANPTALISRAVLAVAVHTWRGDLVAARAELDEMFAYLAATGTPAWQILNIGGLATFTDLARTGQAGPDPALELLLNVDEAQGNAFTRSVALSFQHHYGRAQWLMGNVDETRRVYELIVARTQRTPFQYLEIMKQLLAGLIALTEERFADAEQALLAAAAMQDQTRFSTIYGDAYLLLAALYQRLGRLDDALRVLEPRLAEYAAENTPGVVLWTGRVMIPALQLAAARGAQAPFADTILAAFGVAVETGVVSPAEGGGLRVPRTGALLTPREVDVLRLMSQGASNPEIASQLVISIHTVKTHVANILFKLEVTSRAEAAVYARELGLR